MYSANRSASPSMTRKAPGDISMIDSTSTVNFQPHHFLRSRSLSPTDQCHRPPKAYAVVGATQCGVVIGPPSSKTSFQSHRSTTSGTPPTRYTSPFISTKSRPSLYQRAISESPTTPARGRSRSRSAANSSVSSPVLATSGYSGSMVPSNGYEGYQRQNDDYDSRRDSDSSRCSSRASTVNSITASNPSGKKGFVAKLKSVLKGSAGGECTEAKIIYLTPEEAKQREFRIKRAFHGQPINTGGLGV